MIQHDISNLAVCEYADGKPSRWRATCTCGVTLRSRVDDMAAFRRWQLHVIDEFYASSQSKHA